MGEWSSSYGYQAAQRTTGRRLEVRGPTYQHRRWLAEQGGTYDRTTQTWRGRCRATTETCPSCCTRSRRAVSSGARPDQRGDTPMPRTVESRVAAHRAAAARREAGLPTWAMTINLRDVFHNESMTFPQRRNAIVVKLRASGWPDQNAKVARLVDELARTMNGDHFDEVWDDLYDEADVDRVWLATR